MRRELQAYAETAPGRLPQTHLTTVEGDLLGDDGQPEPRPRGRGAGAARERLEYVLALVRRYPGAVVLHLYEERAVRLLQCDVDSPARPAVERGVVKEVVHEEAEAASPPAQRGSVDRVVELVAHVRMPPAR